MASLLLSRHGSYLQYMEYNVATMYFAYLILIYSDNTPHYCVHLHKPVMYKLLPLSVMSFKANCFVHNAAMNSADVS